MSTLSPSRLSASLLELFDETFYQVHGHYLDRNNSLFESLKGLSAAEASKAIPGGSSIIAHIEHTRSYLDAIRGFATKTRTEKVDWEATWQLQSLDETGWQELQASLAQSYREVINFLKQTAFEGDELEGALDLLVHSAYHLGAIRQILHLAKTL